MLGFFDEMARYEIPFLLLYWSYTLAPIIGGVMFAYHLIGRIKAQDDHEAAEHRRAAYKVAVGTALVFGSLSLLRYAVEFTALGTKVPCYGYGWSVYSCP